jgi:hypothetical protein
MRRKDKGVEQEGAAAALDPDLEGGHLNLELRP